MDPLVYMSLVALSGMALALGVSWVVSKFYGR